MSILRECVLRIPGLDRAALGEGKKALKPGHSEAVSAAPGWQFEASVDLDGGLRECFPSANRWDYGLEIRGANRRRRIEWVEFHPACSSDVDTVIKKKEWLEELLRDIPSCPALCSCNLHWVATGAVKIDFQRRRRMAQAGLRMPRKTLRLPVSSDGL
ncbi:MAG: hypothetical protein WHT08_07835 [Bryobacteraceae bacterium]|jgi:hypothetical protein